MCAPRQLRPVPTRSLITSHCGGATPIGYGGASARAGHLRAVHPGGVSEGRRCSAAVAAVRGVSVGTLVGNVPYSHYCSAVGLPVLRAAGRFWDRRVVVSGDV